MNNVRSLVDLARQRPLTPEERQQLTQALASDEALPVSELELAEALAQGAARLSPEESERLFRGAMAASREPPRAARSRAWPLALAALAACLLAVLALRWPRPPDGRTKGGPMNAAVVLFAQVPGHPSAREVASPVRLSGDEALRLVLTHAEPAFVAIYAEEGGVTRLWDSGETPLPAGQTPLGPREGRDGLKPEGHAAYWIAVSPRREALPEQLDSPERLREACDDCQLIRVEAEAP